MLPRSGRSLLEKFVGDPGMMRQATGVQTGPSPPSARHSPGVVRKGYNDRRNTQRARAEHEVRDTDFFARENRKEQMPKIGGIYGTRIPNSTVRIKDERLYDESKSGLTVRRS